MELYKYKAVDEDGNMSYGRFDAINPGDLEVRLKRIGLELISYRELKKSGPSITGHGIKRADLITFFFHLEHLLRAGVPIMEGLTDLRDTIENERLREVTTAMIESIGGGKGLSEAMRDFPAVFSSVLVNLVNSGEQSGRLSEVLRHITETLKWQDEQAAYTKKLFMYPAIVAVIVLSVLFFLMTYLVPQLLQFVTTMGQELPLHTKILIAVSGFFKSYWYVILLAPVAIAFGIRVMAKNNPEFRLKIDDMKLRLPVIGPILKKLILTRFTNTFAIMYASGIPILECVKISESIVGNTAVEQGLREAGREIADGSGISAAFEQAKLFPPLVLRMLRVGENTGALEESLQNVSYFYTREVRESIDRMQSMIEPAMTMVLGILLAWVMFSVLGPIYDLITKIKI